MPYYPAGETAPDTEKTGFGREEALLSEKEAASPEPAEEPAPSAEAAESSSEEPGVARSKP